MKEQVSAMMDGELADHECEACVVRIQVDSRLRAETWDLYHLIGDSLRGHAAPAVVHRVREKLAAEPTVLAPRAAPAAPRRSAWYALSAAASVAAVGLVGWMALPLFDLQPAQTAAVRVAEALPPQPVVPTAQGVGDYLLAHQRFSPSSQIGGIAPYARTVAEEPR
jgi:sigma-E factor negative regulatory protein RseA